MRTKVKYFVMLLMCIMVTNMVIAQNDKKFKIVMDINENGKHISIDTLFNSEADFKIYMKD